MSPVMLGLVGLSVVGEVMVAVVDAVGVVTGFGFAAWVRVIASLLALRSSATVAPVTASVGVAGVIEALIVPRLVTLVIEPDLSTTP